MTYISSTEIIYIQELVIAQDELESCKEMPLHQYHLTLKTPLARSRNGELENVSIIRLQLNVD